MERNFKNCLLHADRLFSIRRRVTLGKTNVQGGAYFAEFFAWTGEAREELLAEMRFPKGFTFHTSEATMKYLRELLPMEEFELFVWPEAKGFSLSLRFFFVRGAELVAIGDQEICLKYDGRMIPIPETLASSIQQHDPDDIYEEQNQVVDGNPYGRMPGGQPSKG